MGARLLTGVAVACALVLAVPVIQASGGQQSADRRVASLVDQSNKAGLALRQDEAKARADEAIALAEKIGDRLGLAMGRRVKGLAFTRQGLVKEAVALFQQALADFEALGDRSGIALTLAGLLVTSGMAGDNAKVLEYGNRAIKLYEELGDDRGRARILSSFIFYEVAPELGKVRNQEILEIGQRLSDPDLIAHALKNRADYEFNVSELASARLSYEAAIVAFEKGGDLDMVATCYLSLGRVFRAHGDYEGAIVRYQKAIDLLTPTNERYTLVQATNAKAIALASLGRHTEAIRAYELGLALAREGGNQRLIDFMEGNLAGGLQGAGEHERAIPALRAVIAKKPERSLLGYRFAALAESLSHVGRTKEAIEPSTEAVKIAREFKQMEVLGNRLEKRAWMLTRLGRFDEALADVRESLAIVEDIRTKLIPSDFLKRGYAERVQNGYTRIVSLLSHLGRAGEALEFAELGRARAFLDLLATRDSRAPALETRGPTAGTQSLGTELASDAMGKPVTAPDMSRIAERLGSTIVSFWVTDDSTLAFIVRPNSAPSRVHIPITRDRLSAIVAATTAPLRDTSRDTGTRGVDDGTDLAQLPMRGLGLLALGRDNKASWRELHKLLIEPIRAQLPARGGRVTVVPHGPLFQLSFAALQNGAGRYLIEDYELDYAPSISLLEFTGRRQQAVAANVASPWALVGNPSSLPVVGSRPLAPLPGAAREIASIAALAPKGGTHIRLDGARADESAVAKTLDAAHPSVLHFATHGFVFDDPKQPPFLALNRRGTTAADDGRLTLDEVYDLRLMTDLVVLSACRTGAGKVNTDGVTGLTRGFFYAGTPTVMATFWDVTDETTSVLMTSFYRSYAKARTKGPSLRAAQLKLLADLRTGKLVVTVSGRRITLPEHPLLWAAFFLSGEP